MLALIVVRPGAQEDTGQALGAQLFANPTRGADQVVDRPPVGSLDSMLWSAGMETGDLREWWSPCATQGACGNAGGGEFDSNSGGSVASMDVAHSGQWSAKMTITGIDSSSAATRLTRWKEPYAHKELYYSAWYFIPRPYAVGPYGFQNLWQHTSTTGTRNTPIFVIGRLPGTGAMPYLSLTWWPTAEEGPYRGQYGSRNWRASIAMPVGQWFHIETRYVCASDFTGMIQVWQDGALIFDLENIKTGYAGGMCGWSINNYGLKVTPTPVVIYTDDAGIATRRSAVVSR